MIARIRKSMDEKDQGFTLIELLVVMIIIGILAAIAIPVFLSQREKARDTATKADVSNIGKEVATYYVDGTEALTLTAADGDWALNDGTADVAEGTLSNGSALLTSDIVDDTEWCIALTNEDGAIQDFSYSVDGGLAEGDCA